MPTYTSRTVLLPYIKLNEEWLVASFVVVQADQRTPGKSSTHASLAASILHFDFFTNTTLANHSEYWHSSLKPASSSFSTSVAAATFLLIRWCLNFCLIGVKSSLMLSSWHMISGLSPDISEASYAKTSLYSASTWMIYSLVWGSMALPTLRVRPSFLLMTTSSSSSADWGRS